MQTALIWITKEFPVNVGVRELLNVVGALLLVSFLSYLILKIYGKNRAGSCHRGVIKLVDGISLGTRCNIYLIKVLNDYMLVGVTDKVITNLCKFEDLSEEEIAQLSNDGGLIKGYSEKASFSQLFRSVTDRINKQKGEERGKDHVDKDS